MDKKQSLELFQRGERAWNAWADKMVADKMALEESGEWIENRHLWNEQTRAWHEKAKANFRDAAFQRGLYPKVTIFFAEGVPQ